MCQHGAVLLAESVLKDLKATLDGHVYTVDAVLAAIGPVAHAALGRNSTVPAVRALADRDDALATLIRLWPLQQSVRAEALHHALPGLVAPLVSAGLLAGTATSYAPRWTCARTRPKPTTSTSSPI